MFEAHLNKCSLIGSFYWIKKHLTDFLCLFILVPDHPQVRISSSGSTTAGEMYAVTCDVSLNQNLRQAPVIQWVGPSGLVINNSSLDDMLLSSSSPFTSLTLSFTPLHTSHGGSYVCRAIVMDTYANIQISSNNSLIIIIEGR